MSAQEATLKAKRKAYSTKCEEILFRFYDQDLILLVQLRLKHQSASVAFNTQTRTKCFEEQ